ncbi:MAG TPA: hypothetical protein O0Y05_00465 [Methanocorpusculum sp.]|nr:hypothetical protein [Methanocorpusculum sp.]
MRWKVSLAKIVLRIHNIPPEEYFSWKYTCTFFSGIPAQTTVLRDSSL